MHGMNSHWAMFIYAPTHDHVHNHAYHTTPNRLSFDTTGGACNTFIFGFRSVGVEGGRTGPRIIRVDIFYYLFWLFSVSPFSLISFLLSMVGVRLYITRPPFLQWGNLFSFPVILTSFAVVVAAGAAVVVA